MEGSGVAKEFLDMLVSEAKKCEGGLSLFACLPVSFCIGLCMVHSLRSLLSNARV